MRCVHSERGCQWTATVGTLENHLSSCQFVLVPCPNKCEEDKGAGDLTVIRKHLDQHLNTKCPKRAYECPHCGEKGTFASITEDHGQVCEKKIVACPNTGNGCSLSMERGKTEEHVSIDCEYTEVTCVYESLGCGVRMLRKDTASHENEDREKHVDLSLVNIGILSVKQKVLASTVTLYEEKHKSLEKTIALKDKQQIRLTEQLTTLTEQHKQLSKTNELLTEKLEVLSKQHKILSDTVSLTKEQNQIQTTKENFVLKLQGYASMKEKNERFFSTSFYTYPSGYNMCIVIYPNGDDDGKGTHVSVYAKILAGRHDNQLLWPFLGTVTVELLNQFGNDNHHKRDITYYTSLNMRVDSNYGYSKFVPHSSLGHSPAANTQYLLDDALYFRVSVKVDNHKPWLVCTDSDFHRATESSEVVIFRVTEYSKLKARNVRAKSNSFYTGFGGYHMCINVDTNGACDGEGTHVSVFTELLKSFYDNQLHWPFLGTVKIELLNQLGDNNHHSFSISYSDSHNMRVGSNKGRFKFIPHSSLGHNSATNTQYLLDDTLYFRVSVKVDNDKPWLVCTQPIMH